MKRPDIPVYTGNRKSCSQCERKFEEGEVITVSPGGETFCYSDATGGCLVKYVFATGKALAGESMRFKEN